MTIWILLAGVVAPAAFWGAYLYYNDRYKPEPLVKVGAAYLLGGAACWVCLKSYDLTVHLGLPAEPGLLVISDRERFFYYALVVIGPLEELCKFLPFWLGCMRFRAFDEVIDGIIYASAVALGFASFENLLHLPHLDGPMLYARAYASPLVHVVFSSIWGYYCARARLGGRPLAPAALGSLACAAVAHGVYDFLATDPLFTAVSAVVILGVWIWRILTIRRLHLRAGSSSQEGGAS